MQAMYGEDSWTVGETEANGQPVIVRFRSHLPDSADSQRYASLIIIKWRYAANEHGLPLPKDNQDTIHFEDALEAALATQHAAVQAACITGCGLKEWRYYALDNQIFIDCLNQGLAGHPTYPLELSAYQDPSWTALTELLPGPAQG
ncbi:DUF695 domain-containing protein [Leeia sp.]|uniref:DUF695 domain-containing protein n=1 Tax=Leeia sp. TaxID=2884678 RepID=UPI0035B32DC0